MTVVGKVALVTGAACGIGAATAARLAADGAVGYSRALTAAESRAPSALPAAIAVAAFIT